MQNPIQIGSRRELFIDDYLIDRFTGGAQLRLHSPIPRDVALVTDKPWEGCVCNFNTVLNDNGRYRLYYRGYHVDLHSPDSKGEDFAMPRPPCFCLAESDDGIHWERVNTGLFEYNGSRENSIVWMGMVPNRIMHAFSPFIDTNPDCPPEVRYKAVTAEGWPIPGLIGLASADGVKWSVISETPIITGGKFDSHNVVFWDDFRSEYRAYFRDLRDGIRNIRTCTSKDFINWTESEWLDFADAPREQLYTNNVRPYYRTPHIFLGFPARYVEREWSPTIEALPELEHRKLRSNINMRTGTAVTDSIFMSSRDGRAFHRWGEAFIRPGLRSAGNWTYGDNYLAWGMLETDSDLPGGGKELSFYAIENYWHGEGTVIRRHTLRIDGFVSVNSPLSGGEIITKPLIVSGNRLSMNISTSAAGSAWVEIRDENGHAIPGYSLEDCYEIVGDTLDYTVRWKNGTSTSSLAGTPVRLRIVLRDADLYSFEFE